MPRSTLSGFNNLFERIMQKKTAEKYEQQKTREDIERLRGLLHEPEVDVRSRYTTSNATHRKAKLGRVRKYKGG